jgi:calcineurin-like phosphoesterase
VIGVVRETAVSRFVNGLPTRYETASGNPRLNAVVIDADPRTGRAHGITRISVGLHDVDARPEAGR